MTGLVFFFRLIASAIKMETDLCAGTTINNLPVMAGEINIYSIYRTGDDQYYLLRTIQPGFSNASQSEEDSAVKNEQDERSRMLKQLVQNQHIDFIGELQGYPIGERLYARHGKEELNIYYMETGFGHPWIIIGHADSDAGFLTELYNDEDLLGLKPIGPVKQIKAKFFTEKDF